MEEQNKFEDLVLENDSKKNKQKQIVFKFIVFVIIVLVVLIVMKILNASNSSNQALPPISETSTNFESNKDTEVFQKIKSEDEGFADNFSSLEERLKQENNIADDKKTIQASQDTKEAIDNTKAQNTISNEVTNDKKVTTPNKDNNISIPKPAINTKKIEKTDKKITSVFDTLEVSKPAKINKIAQLNKIPEVSQDGSYIQVYAGRKIDLKSHEIKKLDNLGLKYKVVTDSNGMSRVVVGPYSQNNKIDALKYIRANIKKDAFVYRGKI